MDSFPTALEWVTAGEGKSLLLARLDSCPRKSIWPVHSACEWGNLLGEGRECMASVVPQVRMQMNWSEFLCAHL